MNFTKTFLAVSAILVASNAATAFSAERTFSGECKHIDGNGHETIFGSFKNFESNQSNFTRMPFTFPDTSLKFHVTTRIHQNPDPKDIHLQIWLIADSGDQYIARSIAAYVVSGVKLSLSSIIFDGSKKIEVICHGTFE